MTAAVQVYASPAVIGIDPGPTESAWVLYDGKRVLRFGKVPSDQITSAFFQHLDASVVAIEMIQSFGMAVGAEVFETCVWVGRYMERAARAGKEVRRVFRMAVKMHLCHSARAKDANIRAALIDKLGPPGTKKNQGATYGVSGDVWSALGVAVMAMETRP